MLHLTSDVLSVVMSAVPRPRRRPASTHNLLLHCRLALLRATDRDACHSRTANIDARSDNGMR
jgi:hypothetical protein